MAKSSSIEGAAAVVSATIGAGIFALPHLANQSGWVVTGIYLVLLSAVVILAHQAYWLELEGNAGRHRLVGLVERSLGPAAAGFGLVTIVIGLSLTLTAYIILAAKFINMLWPGIGWYPAVILFWFLGTLPTLLRVRQLARVEIVSSIGILAAIVFVAWRGAHLTALPPPVVPGNWFLPFGPILFALAGWTAVEPVFTLGHKSEVKRFNSKIVLTIGTIIAAAGYALFIFGVIGLTGNPVADTLSGLSKFSWEFFVLAALGLLALWGSFAPIALEITNTLSSDLGWRRQLAEAVVAAAPLAVVLSGANDFMRVVSLVGGFFVAAQYVLILLLGAKKFSAQPFRVWLYRFLAAIFILAAIYEIYYGIRAGNIN